MSSKYKFILQVVLIATIIGIFAVFVFICYYIIKYKTRSNYLQGEIEKYSGQNKYQKD